MSTTVVGRQPSMSPTQPTPVPKPAAMEPKEHGAYAILGIPIASSLLIAGASVPGVCIAIAAVAGFLAHEPLLIVCGSQQRARHCATTKQLLLLLLVTSPGGTTALMPRFASGSLVSAGLHCLRPVSRWLSRAGTARLEGSCGGSSDCR
ncbi:MAG: YwiC-like family protein [Pirellulaceae bacterium]